MYKILSFLIYSNLYISINAGFLTYAFGFYINLDKNLFYALFVFFGTLIIYNSQRIVRLKHIENINGNRLVWFKKRVSFIYFIILFSFFTGAYIYFFKLFNTHSFGLLFIFVLIGLLYAVRITPKRNAIREVPNLKIHLIAMSWLMVCFIWPQFNEGKELFENGMTNRYVSIYFFFLAITIPFDIRDLPYDKSGQYTFPQLLGVKYAKILALSFLLLFAILNFNELQTVFHFTYFFIFIIYTASIIYYSKKERGELYFSGLADLSIAFLAGFWLVIS